MPDTLRSADRGAVEHDKKVDVVNRLTLKALRDEDFSPDPNRARKLAAVLRACGEVMEKAGSRRAGANAHVCNVCRQAAVSEIAHVLLDDDLDHALDVLKEELGIHDDRRIQLSPVRQDDVTGSAADRCASI